MEFYTKELSKLINSIIKRVNLNLLVDEYLCSAVLLVSSVIYLITSDALWFYLIIYSIIIVIWRFVIEPLRAVKHRFKISKSLENLTDDEKAILNKYIINNKISYEFCISNGVVASLCDKGILKLATINSIATTTDDTFYDFNIDSYILAKLRKEYPDGFNLK